MAAKKTTLEELGEMLSHVVKHMATKDDLEIMDTKLMSFQTETAENFRSFREETAENFREVKGFE